MYFFSHLSPLMNEVSICNFIKLSTKRLGDEEEEEEDIQGRLLEKMLQVIGSF